jgi:hypothetical protein
MQESISNWSLGIFTKMGKTLASLWSIGKVNFPIQAKREIDYSTATHTYKSSI